MDPARKKPGRNAAAAPAGQGRDPQWYKDAVIYELHVKSFYDSDGDGIGDFPGLTGKLDYLHGLGITAIWLLPFYPSPLKDDGYDIADFFNVNPQYGTLSDFKAFLREAHARGIRVITELVLNHTSDQHEWFRRSRRAAPGSPWRNYYVWSDTPDKYQDARIIFTDTERSNWTWDPEAKAYFWHRFFSHQPDLNYDNPEVVKATMKVMDFWFGMGVDGMRLDAVPYLFEREGTNCENLPETYAYLEALRAHVDKKFGDRLLLAEANQWPEDAVAYFGKGNRCHMAFHFPVMPRLFMASWMEDRFPVIDIFDQTPAIPDSCQWAIFLRNHDELTLEMVSDEERDYMYRMYARDPNSRINVGIRRRLAPLLNNNRAKIELMNILLLSLPGTPVIYYGDEILMGDNHYLGDRNGVRTPMQWSADRNAGFSGANPQKLFLPVIIDPDYHYESNNVENFERNRSSMLWWMKRVIAMRRRFRAFSRGSMKFIDSDNPKILSFVREFGDEKILVVVNLSRFSQVVTLDMTGYTGRVPEEVAGGNLFPEIRDASYTLTLGFHDYYWLLLGEPADASDTDESDDLPSLSVTGSWRSVFRGKALEALQKRALPRYLKRQRWFGSKARVVQQVRVVENIPVGTEADAVVVLAEVRFSHGPNDLYLVPMAFSTGEEAAKLRDTPAAVVASVKTGAGEGLLHDGVQSPAFRRHMLRMIAKKQKVKGSGGELVAWRGSAVKLPAGAALPADDSTVVRAEQSNTSILYGRELFLKLFRRVEEGINPELEMGRHLAEEAGYTNTPAFAGAVEYRRRGAEPVVLAVLQKYVPNESDAWSFTLNSARQYFERVLASHGESGGPVAPAAGLPVHGGGEADPRAAEMIGGVYMELAGLLGRRTAELHLALAAPTGNPDFSPEPFTLLYQRSLYHAMRTQTRRVLELLRKNLKSLDPSLRAGAGTLIGMEGEIISRFAKIFERKIRAQKIRIHGDYHLGQVLFTGNDFQIIDFEGEPSMAVGERRLKRSPLRDVAGMVRSFHYAAHAMLFDGRTFTADQVKALAPWADAWYRAVAGVFLQEYLGRAGDAGFVPATPAELNLMLGSYLLEKALYELGYELNNRPAWLRIPLDGIGGILGRAL